MNIVEHVSLLRVRASSGYMPRIGIAGSGSTMSKLEMLKIQFTDHMKLKKKEDQSVDTLVLLLRGIKTPMAHSQPIECA